MTKKTFPIQFILTAIALVLFISLTSCNTVNGIGKDLQILGKKMEETSDDSTSR